MLNKFLGLIDEHHLINIKHNELDTGEILKQASIHRILPIIYSEIMKLNWQRKFHSNIIKLMRTSAYSCMEMDITLNKEAINILNALEKKNITGVILKGPILSVYLYPEFGLRSYGDIDILVKKSDLSRSKEIMREQHYLQGDFDFLKNDIVQSSRSEIVSREMYTHETVEFRKKVEHSFLKSLVVDINHSTTWKGHSDYKGYPKFNTEIALSSIHSYISKYGEIKGLTPELTLIHLCLHLYSEAVFFCWQSFWSRNFGDLELIKYLDIALFLKKELDWQEFSRLVQLLDVKEPIIYVFSLTLKLFPELPISSAIKDYIEIDISSIDYYYTKKGEKKYWKTPFLERVFSHEKRWSDYSSELDLSEGL